MATRVGGQFFAGWDFGDSGALENGKMAHEAYRKLAEEAVRKAEEIEADETLSAEGKRQAKREWARGKLNDPDGLTGWEDRGIGQIRRIVDELEEEARPYEPLEPGDAAGAIEAVEIRSTLRELDRSDRVKAAMQAARDGNEKLVRAVDQAEELRSGVPAEVRDKLRRDATRARNPELVDRLDTFRSALDRLERDREAAKAAIRNVGGLAASEGDSEE